MFLVSGWPLEKSNLMVGITVVVSGGQRTSSLKTYPKERNHPNLMYQKLSLWPMLEGTTAVSFEAAMRQFANPWFLTCGTL